MNERVHHFHVTAKSGATFNNFTQAITNTSVGIELDQLLTARMKLLCSKHFKGNEGSHCNK